MFLVVFTLDNGIVAKRMDMVALNMEMAESPSLASGWKTSSMVVGCKLAKMVRSTLVSLSVEINKAMASTIGLTVPSTQASGMVI